jgi:hypothetical protein
MEQEDVDVPAEPTTLPSSLASNTTHPEVNVAKKTKPAPRVMIDLNKMKQPATKLKKLRSPRATLPLAMKASPFAEL